MNPDIKILAHRGGMERAPENTIAAFRQALDDGADAFECDVRLTKDQEPIIIHTGFDRDDIEAVTGCSTPLRELNWSDVQTLKVMESNEPIAHLDGVLSFVRDTGLPCFIEPKESSEALIPIVVERIHQSDLVDKVDILTFDSRRELLLQAKQLQPEIQTSVIIINPMANFLKAAESIDAGRVIIGWSRINHFCLYNFFFRSLTRKVRQLRAKGIAVEGGFARTRHDVEWLLRHEIGGLWTDNVPRIREFVEALDR
ncbi:MAG: glycerophosphodiester phosphodiesterase [Candidatus Poribacteria bacterium]|nr:glycerophosphodiester phosphodiesterase [Candidatus Poribacteria bacterium]